ncbi:hypothetical protein H7347_05025 [Corynebacterium sp. zg-331]|uniref:hypothetical protein n=1 Tax=unclassified Corynebacterium TaxID=2624378 RepID=UPI00128B5A81|nr:MULTISPECIES: hypothetical protein [unclassified Corynebacterium]MBC3185939.1 hypothetical protein [Corynebacterium sp. zg-331]MPV52430.1 hypothetical protein [Corynebacterium sp. zg331]
MKYWLRARGVWPAVAVAVLASQALSLASLATLRSGGDSDILALWIAALIALPLGFVFVSETHWEKLSPRPVRRQRLILLIAAVVLAAILAVLSFPTRVTDFGVIAVLRDCIGLWGIGLWGIGLLGACLWRRAAIWVLPLAAVLCSMMFAWPLRPSSWQSMWGAFRAPGTTVMYGGAWDLSVPTCLCLGLAGAWAYLNDVHPRGAGGGVSFPRGALPRFRAAGGPLRASFAPLLAGVVLVHLVWAFLASLGRWGGSPRIFLGEEYPLLMFQYLPIAAAVGVIVGQWRWRSGVVEWQRLSTRHPAVVMARSCAIAVSVVIVPHVLVLIACAGSASFSVPRGVVGRELVAYLPHSLAALGLAAAVAGAGAALGVRLRQAWWAPLLFIAVFAAAIPVRLITQDNIDRAQEREYGLSECANAGGVEICAAAPNAEYLPAAVRTISAIYGRAADPATLPQRFALLNTVYGDTAQMPADRLSLSLDGQRGLRPPDALGEYEAIESIVVSSWSVCPGRGDELREALYGQPVSVSCEPARSE